MNLNAIFNKKTKRLVSFISDDDLQRFPLENFLLKTFEVSDLNLERWRIEGDYDNCRLIDMFLEKKSVVEEEAINQKYKELFFRKYNLQDILFALIDQDQSLDILREFKRKLDDKKQKEIDKYKSEPYYIFESTEEQIEREAEIFS